MGGKPSSEKESASSLNPNERRRLTAFLESRSGTTQFDHHEMQNMWKDYLVPDLLQGYVNYLMKQDTTNKNFIGLNEFVLIYSALIRGSAEEKAQTIAGVIGYRKNSAGIKTVSYNNLVKYMCDLIASYFLGLKQRNEEYYRSWTHNKQPQRNVMEQIMKGVCSDLTRKADEVQLQDLEKWLNLSIVSSVLHSYVLGSLYNLEPENKATIIPRAILPTTKTPLFLDLSQVVYINSFLPSQNKSQWRFLFSTSTHGESFSKLVGCITMQGPILIVIESDSSNIFGGFITGNLTPGPRWVGSEDCFLFRLSPIVEVFPATGYNDHYAYLNMHQSSLPNGLGMGGQFNYWGLWIDSAFGNGECSESCTTYKNYKTLCPKKKFHINKLEAWGVGEPSLSPEELGERRAVQTSVLDKDTAASHMLEMAGRKVYSKGLRDSPPL